MSKSAFLLADGEKDTKIVSKMCGNCGVIVRARPQAERHGLPLRFVYRAKSPLPPPEPKTIFSLTTSGVVLAA